MTQIWLRNLSRPVKIASFSHDASLIASTGRYDRLIKLWKRQSYGTDDTRFDFTYLSHPATVTGIHWRRLQEGQHYTDNVVYSICRDSKIRIWTAVDPHGPQAFQLWAEIDMQESIQPRHLEAVSPSEPRYAFIIDSCDFLKATDQAVQAASNGGQEENHALEHLMEVVKSNPEICVILDTRGHLSAWGLQDLECKTRQASSVFNVAHVENFGIPISKESSAEANFHFLNFCDQQTDSAFALVLHDFDGSISWLGGSLDELFDPSPRQQRLRTKALWTGHDSSIKKIVRSVSGKAAMSRTNDNEALIWKQSQSKSATVMSRLSSIDCPEHIHRSWLLRDGDWIVNLHHHSISLWSAQCSPAKLAGSCAFDLEAKLLCLVPLPKKSSQNPNNIYLATISADMMGIAWEITLPSRSARNPQSSELREGKIRQFCTFAIGLREDLAFMLPVDPAGSSDLISSTFDAFATDVAISYTRDGILRSWTADVDLQNSSVKWLATSRIETGVDEPFLASGSSIRKTALVDSSKTRLTIWDMQSGQLEHDEQYGALDPIQDLDWSSTPDDQSILAVGFPHKVVILAQMRYDYYDVGPAWAPIRQINLGQSTPHPIGDSTWLGSGSLLVGAGNQLVVYDKQVTSTDDMILDLSVPVHKRGPMDLFNLVTYLNGPLPLFHPQFLSQCILAGKLVQVQKIILNLFKALKFFTDGDDLDSFVSMSPADFYVPPARVTSAAREEKQSSYITSSAANDSEAVSENVATALNEILAKKSVPQVSSKEQIHLANMVECVATVEKHRRSMDENAMRYLLFFRQHMIRKNQVPADQAGITFREIVWAYHSSSQDILLDLVSRQFHNRMLWKHARESGAFMWMTDPTALKTHFETIARNEYTKTDEKNPIDCSLYYLALKKKSVLLGLWRMASWNREQASTQRLLSNNFSDPRWKTAALKNAYALLGKRRFEYAAAFFLLAGNLQDAVNVCLLQVRDLQLAVAVARVYEGADKGPVLRSLLEEKVLPQAGLEGNRWLASWACWMLGRREFAVRTLIEPVHKVLGMEEKPRMQARSWRASDPALVVLYKQLRASSKKEGNAKKERLGVGVKMEWDFVMSTARSYRRMCCDLLALDLVRNWEFWPLEDTNNNSNNNKEQSFELSKINGSDAAAVVVNGIESNNTEDHEHEHEQKPKQTQTQTQFVEPDASSLLDSFGF